MRIGVAAAFVFSVYFCGSPPAFDSSGSPDSHISLIHSHGARVWSLLLLACAPVGAGAF